MLDEAEELIDENIFDTIDLSIREKEIQNRIILVLNPVTKDNWIYERFFEGKGIEAGFNGIKDNVCYIHSTYLDNKDNLSESFLKRVEAIKHNNYKKYNQKLLGQWLDRAEGVVFDNWSVGEFNPNNLQTSCGLDFGFSIDPDSLTEVAIDKKHKKIYLKEHLYRNGLKSQELAKIVLDKVGETLIIADKGSKLYVDNYNHAIDGVRYNVIYHLDNPNIGKYYVQ